MKSEPFASRAPSPAEDLFADYVLGLSGGKPDDFDALCEAHPTLAVELRELHARHFGAKGLQRALDLGSLPSTARGAGTQNAAILEELKARGAQVARYRVVEKIGAGGMGTVYDAEDVLLGRRVALKVISDVGRTRDLLPLFHREMRIAARISHPGVAGIHDAGVDEQGRAFFTMPLVRGRDLSEVFRFVRTTDSGWTLPRALGVLRQVCETMAYVHSRGVIHRDLKPANVRVGDYGEVYVMDWGLAKVTAEQEGAQAVSAPGQAIGSLSGQTKGTPVYMSPEQAHGDLEALGPATDVYAIGAMLYELLAGHAPYREKDEEPDSERDLKRVRAGPPAALGRVARDAPAELVAICERTMTREAKARYPDMSALAADLASYLETRVVSAYETGTWAETKKWVQRNKALAIALAGVLVVAVAGGAAFALKADEATQQALLAEANAARATEQERIAIQRAAELAIATLSAQDKEREAAQRASDVLSLSAVQELKELEDRADALWPAHPDMVPKYEVWLADARRLIDGQSADPKNGLKKRPSVAEHEAKLADIRRRAKALTPEQVERDRRASPSYAEWEKARSELQWMRRMLGEEPWPNDAQVETELVQVTLPTDAKGLNDIAWPLVDTSRTKIVYGNEVKALALAERAVTAAAASERPRFRVTLAWAFYRTARFDKSRAEGQLAVVEVDAAKQEEYEGYLAALERAISEWSAEESRATRREEASQLADRVTGLERDVNERRTYEFDTTEDQWWHLQLAQLVNNLGSFTDQSSGGLYSAGTSEKHGHGILAREQLARSIGLRSVSDSDAKHRWDEAILAIVASKYYRIQSMSPQMGLLPIGVDPHSQLWEFAHLQSGVPPDRSAAGTLTLSEESGLVFVLIPGGTFRMGAQKEDPDGPNFDAAALNDETPVHEIELSPYFISKYEMTQAQWLKATGRNPSYYDQRNLFAGHQHTLLHPVEQISWTDCAVVLPRLGLSLPTEAQWERACRAETNTVWWTGQDRESLRGKANLADKTAKDSGATWGDLKDWPDLIDGWALHAAIGSFPANRFGLHEVHGNVWEWCQDSYQQKFYSWGPKLNPVSHPEAAWNKISRGGSFSSSANSARSALRYVDSPEVKANRLGVRPARALAP